MRRRGHRVVEKRNGDILPIARNKKIVLIGEPEIHSGSGSGFVAGYDHVSYESGLRNAYGERFTYCAKIDEPAVRNADVVFFNFNKSSGEGHDVPFQDPQATIDDLNAIIKLNKNVVVLMNAANPMPMGWLKNVKGLLWCGYLGQERGNALANIVSGKVSPSGKLPFSIEDDFADSPDPDFNHVGGTPVWYGNNEYKRTGLETPKSLTSRFQNTSNPIKPLIFPMMKGFSSATAGMRRKTYPCGSRSGLVLAIPGFNIRI